MNRKITRQVLAVMALDMLMLIAAGGLALLLRFDFSFEQVPDGYVHIWHKMIPLQLALTLALFWFRKMYQYVWRSVSARDVAEMILNTLLAGVVCDVATLLLGLRMPLSVQFLSILFQVVFLVGERCILRFYEVLERLVRRRERTSKGGMRTMLIGAGEAGRVLLRESLYNKRAEGTICCIVDDDPNKWGKFLDGVPIVGGREKIQETVWKEDVDQIILAIPSASPEEKHQILAQCRETGCRLRTLPCIYELVSGKASLSAVKDVEMEDLLGREPVKLDMAVLDQFLRGRTVLVTGGGGSIGSELCRQIAAYRPKRLIILDIYENNAYEIQQELNRLYSKRLDLRVEIASIRDKERVYQIFERYRPEIVFHAAAHKHVPLMEQCPGEAVKNNVFGTYHVVRAAEKYGVKKFVMISTDKAVNPTNFMGATKRFCEMILQSRKDSPTEFCAVRFGNVLGSNGSVVPLFKKQIAAGGPVTITDRRITRFFMTIPEAAQLVLEAGAMAKQSQIFVLDMGEPVRILDLAENLILLSGLKPYQDIDIQEIGLRPGEKLYEELLMRSETLAATENRKIFVEQQEEISPDLIMDDLERLDRAVTEERLSDGELIALMKGMVPTYCSPEEVNRTVSREDWGGSPQKGMPEPPNIPAWRERKADIYAAHTITRT